MVVRGRRRTGSRSGRIIAASITGGRGIPAGTAVPSRIPVAAVKRRLAPKGRFAVLFLDGHVEVRQADSPDEAGLIRGLLKDEAFDGRREIESLLLKNRMEE